MRECIRERVTEMNRKFRMRRAAAAVLGLILAVTSAFPAEAAAYRLSAPDVVENSPASVSASIASGAGTEDSSEHTIEIDGQQVRVLRTTNRYVYLKRESRVYVSPFKDSYITTLHTGMGVFQTYVLDGNWSQILFADGTYYVYRSNIVYSTDDIAAVETAVAPSAEDVATILKLMKRVPARVRRKFRAMKYSVEVPESGVSVIYPNITTGAAYADSAHRIFLDEDKIKSMLYHEFGHFWDRNSGLTKTGKLLSQTKRFRKIWRAERKKAVKKAGLNSIVRKNAQEYFARCFAMYCKKKTRKVLRKTCPRTYRFIRSTLKAS